MTFLRVLLTEIHKLRRTLAVWVVFAAPFVIVLLQFLMFHQRAEYFATKGVLWPTLANNCAGMWGVLMLPLFITLETSLLAGLEHAEKHWRHLLSLAIDPAWFYLAKLVVVLGMVAAAQAVVASLTIGAGLLLRTLKPGLQFPDPIPFELVFGSSLRLYLSALLIVAIHHWVSLRWPSYAFSLGFGMCAMVAGFLIMQSPRYAPWFPWTYPVLNLGMQGAPRIELLYVSAAGAAVLALAGALEFRRRDVA
ncbi:MAG: ABC transporter permease [Bryobacteraceae bacterium]|nr:ABC transporter permease [Bryobacteraceae bacterium]